MKKLELAAICFMLSVLSFGQGYENATGSPRFSTSIPVEAGFINAANGNLHLEIPVYSSAQRGSNQFIAKFVYDSKIWGKQQEVGSSYWHPWNVGGWGGWRFIATGDPGSVNSQFSQTMCEASNGFYDFINRTDGYRWVSPNGTEYTFPNYLDQNNCTGDTYSLTIGNDLQGAGYRLDTSVEGNPVVLDRNGQQVYPVVKDKNGNFFTFEANGEVIDTLGRKPYLITNPSSNQKVYSFWNSQGSRTNVTVTFTTISVNTAFGQAGYSEYSGNITVIQSIQLMDGTTYEFTYPSGGYGEVLTVKLPQGGVVAYGYSLYADPANNKQRWLTARYKDQGTWNITPSVISTTSQKVKVEEPAPSGANRERTEYEFLLNEGAWETVQSHFAPGGTTPISRISSSYTFLNNGEGYTQSTTIRTLTNNLNSKTETVLDIFGNVLSTKEWDFYSGSAPANPYRQTVNTYESNSTYVNKNIRGLLTRSQIKDGSGAVVADTQFFYDNQALTSTSGNGIVQHDYTGYSTSNNVRGNLTDVNPWLNGAPDPWIIHVRNFYDDLGNVIKVKDGGLHETNIAYSNNFHRAYPTQVTAPPTGSITHVSLASYDFNTGLKTSDTDENSQTTSYNYDFAMRPTSITRPVGGGSSVYTYPSALTKTTKHYLTQSAFTESNEVIDAFGRTIRVALLNDDPDTLGHNIQDTCYDSISGRVSFVSYPRQDAYPASAQQCAGSGDRYTYGFSGLVRTARVTHPDYGNPPTNDFAETSALDRAVMTEDEGNGTRRLKKIQQVDAFGRTVSVCEVTGSTQEGSGGTPAECNQDIAATGFITTYQYDLMDRLTQVNQGSLNPRQYFYDTLGRLTSSIAPETGSAPSTFTYDADGNVLTRVRPKQNQTNNAITVTTSYQYDEHHRLVQRWYNDGGATPTPQVNFYYDESSFSGTPLTNTKGRLSHSRITNVSQDILSYDAMGRTVNNWQQTPGSYATTSYSLAYSYDFLGNMTSYTNGTGYTFNQTFNRAGQLTSLKIPAAQADATHPENLITGMRYNAFGQLRAGYLGNGLVNVNLYDNSGKTTWITVGTGCTPAGLPTTCSDFRYWAADPIAYWPNGNIKYANDAVNGTFNYTYDDFGRLASSSKTGQAYDFKYDRFGNRTKQTVTAGTGSTVDLSFDLSNRVTGYCYDAIGNLLKEAACPVDMNTVTFKYDAEGRLIEAPGATYKFDAFGRRVRKTVNGVSLDYLYDLAARPITTLNSSGTAVQSEIFADGMHVATYVNGTTQFVHADWLGTERRRTNLTGGIITASDCLSGPFGDNQTCTGEKTHFTGHDYDSETGNSHTLFREYDKEMARWTTPDLLHGWAGDPQSLNRYAYVLGDPINYWDPFGLEVPPEIVRYYFSLGCTVREVRDGVHQWYEINCDRVGGTGGGGGGGGSAAPAPLSTWKEPPVAFQQKYHGNYCGPNWTGGRKEPYNPGNEKLYKKPVDQLDRGCRSHDMCYQSCRANNPCNSQKRGQCMTTCDRRLSEDGAAAGAKTGSPLYWWMSTNNSPDTGPNGASCTQSPPPGKK